VISKHCGMHLYTCFENKRIFAKKCPVCRKLFKQRKRVAKVVVAS
jgi:hypothetical protein